jgi:hypothetical protein
MASGNLNLVGEGEPPLWPTEILLRAEAAPVFADSMIFLKNPVFFVFGVDSPPKTPGDSPTELFPGDQGTAEYAPCLEVLWLEWYEIPVRGVCGLEEIFTKSLNPLGRTLSMAVFGLSLKLPSFPLLAKLPALVALKPPAEGPLIML